MNVIWAIILLAIAAILFVYAPIAAVIIGVAMIAIRICVWCIIRRMEGPGRPEDYDFSR